MNHVKTFVRMDGICPKCKELVCTEVTWEYYMRMAGATPGTKLTAEAFLNQQHKCEKNENDS